MIALMLAARTMLPASTPAASSPTAMVTASGASATPISAAIRRFAGRGISRFPTTSRCRSMASTAACTRRRTRRGTQPEDADGNPQHTRRLPDRADPARGEERGRSVRDACDDVKHPLRLLGPDAVDVEARGGRPRRPSGRGSATRCTRPSTTRAPRPRRAARPCAGDAAAPEPPATVEQQPLIRHGDEATLEHPEACEPRREHPDEPSPPVRHDQRAEAHQPLLAWQQVRADGRLPARVLTRLRPLPQSLAELAREAEAGVHEAAAAGQHAPRHRPVRCCRPAPTAPARRRCVPGRLRRASCASISRASRMCPHVETARIRRRTRTAADRTPGRRRTRRRRARSRRFRHVTSSGAAAWEGWRSRPPAGP